MTLEKLNEAIKKRAHEKVAKRIQDFQSGLLGLLRELLKESYVCTGSHELVPLGKAVMLVMASKNHNTGWPAELWAAEEIRTQAEILSTMDVVQQAMIARAPGADDPKPAEEPVK